MLFEALDLCRSRLEPAMRDLLDAKYLEGASVGEIAVRLGASTKAVESRLTRARAELRHLLEEELKRHE
jgi:RNA polymerase sigma factor (sigma-70 family)